MPEKLHLPPEVEKYYERWKKDPKSRVFAQLADAYRKSGLLDEAIDVCLEGLKVHPSYGSAMMVLARAYQEKGMDEEAKKEFLEVIKNDPENVLARRMLGELLYKGGKVHEAIEQYQLVLKLTPLDRETKGFLEKAGATLQASAAPGPAVIEVETAELTAPPPGPTPPVEERREEPVVAAALELSDKEEDAFLTETVADLYLNQGLYDRAMEIFSKMLSADPDNFHIQQRLQEAILLRKIERPEPVPPTAVMGTPEEGATERSGEGEGLKARSDVPSLFAEERPTPLSTVQTLDADGGASAGLIPLLDPRKHSLATFHRWLEAIKQTRSLREP